MEKVELEYTLKDWQDLDMHIGGIVGKENIMTDMGMRKHVCEPVEKHSNVTKLGW